jgi:hypothetical protein
MSETQIRIVTSNETEIFDLRNLPDPKSRLIKQECSIIKDDINLQNLVSDFAQFSKHIHLAENGVAGRYQIQIQVLI